MNRKQFIENAKVRNCKKREKNISEHIARKRAIESGNENIITIKEMCDRYDKTRPAIKKRLEDMGESPKLIIERGKVKNYFYDRLILIYLDKIYFENGDVENGKNASIQHMEQEQGGNII